MPTKGESLLKGLTEGRISLKVWKLPVMQERAGKGRGLLKN